MQINPTSLNEMILNIGNQRSKQQCLILNIKYRFKKNPKHYKRKNYRMKAGSMLFKKVEERDSHIQIRNLSPSIKLDTLFTHTHTHTQRYLNQHL